MTSSSRTPSSRARLVGAVAMVALVVGAATAGGFIAFAQSATPEGLRPAIATRYPEVSWVTTAQLARWLRDEPAPILLDTRTEAEFDVSHLDGATRLEPDGFDADSIELPHQTRVVVYCSVGWRSGAVADAMRRAGFTDVSNLEGGLFAWANEGRALVNAEGATDRVHPYDATWGRLLHPSRRAPLP